MQIMGRDEPKISALPVWRFIPPIKASGAMQMAIDRYLLEKHLQGEYPPLLRFYTWCPGAISLGYHQKDYPQAWHNLAWQGEPLEIVRRPTGGRAVLHQGDLTYMVVTSTLPGKRLEVYKQICQFLLDGWRSLGVNLDYGRSTKEYIQNHNCFATATGADLITAGGDKVIGSAQLRRRKAVLQHGSMILNTDKSLFEQVFGRPVERNLFELIPQKRDRTSAKIIKSLTQAAIATFKIDLVEQSLSTAECQDIASNFSLLRY